MSSFAVVLPVIVRQVISRVIVRASLSIAVLSIRVLAVELPVDNLAEMKGHSAAVCRAAWVPGPEPALITGDWNGQLILWDAVSKRKRKELGNLIGFIRSLQSFDQGRSYAACVNSKVVLGSLKGSRTVEVAQRDGNAEYNAAAAVSPDDTTVAVLVSSKQVELFATSNGDSKGVLQLPAASSTLTYGPDGRLFVASMDGRNVWVFETGNPAPSATITSSGGRFEDIAVSPDGRMLACASGESLQVCRLTGSRPELEKRPVEGSIESVSWAPDSGRIAVSGSKGVVYIFTAVGNRPREQLTLQRGQTSCVAYSSNGQFLAIGSGHYLDMSQRPPRQMTGDNVVRLLPQQIVPSSSQRPQGTTSPNTADVAARLQILRQQFEAARDRELQATGGSAAAQVRAQYAAKLDAAMTAAAQTLRLEEVLAFKQEKEAATQGLSLPALPAGTSAALKTLRADHDKAWKEAVAKDAARIQPMYEVYLNALLTYMNELTRTQRLEEALSVKKEWEAVSLERKGGSL